MGTYSDLIQTPPSPTLKNEQEPTAKKRTFERSLDATNHGNKLRTVQPTKQPPTHPSIDRTKTRHTFDIFADQLQSFHQYQLECMQAGGQKPRLGEMVQEALDDYLAKKGVGKHEP